MTDFDITTTEAERKGAPDHAPVDVGDIGNYYGGLRLRRNRGLYYWSVTNWDGEHWSVLPSHVADALRSIVDPGDLATAIAKASAA